MGPVQLGKKQLGFSVKEITYTTPKLPISLFLYLGSGNATKSSVAHFVCQQFSSDGNVTCVLLLSDCPLLQKTHTKLAQLFTLTGLEENTLKQLKLPLLKCL